MNTKAKKKAESKKKIVSAKGKEKEIEKFFPNLASSIKDIMSSILPKYNQNL